MGSMNHIEKKKVTQSDRILKSTDVLQRVLQNHQESVILLHLK